MLLWKYEYFTDKNMFTFTWNSYNVFDLFKIKFYVKAQNWK